VETDKAVVSFEMDEDGILAKIIVSVTEIKNGLSVGLGMGYCPG